MYQVTKTYGAERGLSACFRQWRAKSHCRFLHGYALGFEFVFEASELDQNNWVIDFGSLKPLKSWLDETFDHKLVIAFDDPQKSTILEMGLYGIADINVLSRVGCEAFARLAFDRADLLLGDMGIHERVKIVSVRCFEHSSNSATYKA